MESLRDSAWTVVRETDVVGFDAFYCEMWSHRTSGFAARSRVILDIPKQGNKGRNHSTGHSAMRYA